MRLNAGLRLLAAIAVVAVVVVLVGEIRGCVLKERIDSARRATAKGAASGGVPGESTQAQTPEAGPTPALPDCTASSQPLKDWPAGWSLETYKSAQPDLFIDCVTSRKPTLRNEDNTSALGNVLQSPAGAGFVALVGHGGPGTLCTGFGNRCGSEPSSQISQWNVDGKAGWGRLITAPPPKMDGFMFLSCGTGAEDAGADLLFSMAQKLGCPVHARTFLVWCKAGEILLDNRGTWQVADPAHRPTAIPAPDVPVSTSGLQIEVVRLTYTPDGQQPLTMVIDPADGQSLAPRIGLSAPCRTAAYPAAYERGFLEVRTRPAGGGGAERGQAGAWTPLTLRILGDQILQDVDRSDVYYYVTSDFHGALRTLVSRYTELKRVTPPVGGPSGTNPLTTMESKLLPTATASGVKFGVNVVVPTATPTPSNVIR